MHTLKTTIDGREAYLNHNGDWSGDVIATWADEKGVTHEVELPGQFFVAAGVSIARGVLENVAAVLDDKLVELEKS